MSNLAVPIAVAVLTSFGVAFGWILHRAVEQAVYKITGIRALDSYLLSWLFGLFVAFSPAVLYLAFGFNEFADTPDGVKLLQRLHRAGQALLAALVIQYSPISPMKALFWSAVINGVVAVPLMAEKICYGGFYGASLDYHPRLDRDGGYGGGSRADVYPRLG